MAKKLESDMLPLTKLFSQDFFFRIPEYQRPFLWDDEDFTNLIDDLSTAQRDEPYFLGTLVLHKSKQGEYDVVDGQQRLTALCILLACMRDALDTTDDDQDHQARLQVERALGHRQHERGGEEKR
jgi:uncharacterized protein with ParB-like and HNH nuclease domain